MDQTAETAAKPAYKRILLKLSGEALMGEDSFGINRTVLARMVEEIKSVVELGVQVGIVVGGGNIFRGVALGATGMDRATGDYMGMLATVMNAMALQDACRNNGVEARVQSALNIEQVAEPYIRGKALRHLRLGRVVIFAAGTGNPFMTTDTTAALRGAEIGAEIVIKATKVDGIYTADPKKDPTATMFDEITFDDALRSNLKVMDATAFALCREQGLPIKVFNINKKGALRALLCLPCAALSGYKIMKIVIAPDSYKESLSASEVAQAIEKGFREIFPDAQYVSLPVADGGEGTVEAMVEATDGKMVMLPAMGLFYVSDLMGGAKNLLIGNVIKSQFLNIRDWPFGAATSITLTLVMGLMLLIYWRAARLLNKKVELE